MIPLVCGNPAKEPASYTRFVLPFAYKPEACSEQAPSYVYKPSKPVSVERQNYRQNYLTVETAAALFHRAKWLELKGTEPMRDFKISRGGRNITVRLGTPRLVLFECPTDPRTVGEDDQGDPLCIGFLIVEVSFPKQDTTTPDLDDLLEFNEKFRHWQQPYAGYEERYKSFLAECPLYLHHPSRVVRDGDPSALYFFDRWASLLELPIEDEKGDTWRLFPKAWGQKARAWVRGDRDVWDSGWIVYTDPRAFVWTCAIVKHGGKKLAERFCPPAFDAQPRLEASAFGHWIKLLNVDSPGTSPADTHRSTGFERDWARERTYHRWEENGTFYGFNSHCGAMLRPPLQEPYGPPLWQHFGEMYFDQTLLLLYLRVGSFRYSRRLSRISTQARKAREGDEAWQRTFRELRWSFALFTNLYEFPLLSHQQQGVEMYELARKYLDVEELFREIQEEIRSSHEYLEVLMGQKQTEITTLLTVVATMGLAIGLAIGFLGMNILTVQPTPQQRIALIGWEWLGLTGIGSIGLLALFVWRSKSIAKLLHGLSGSSFWSWLRRKK